MNNVVARKSQGSEKINEVAIKNHGGVFLLRQTGKTRV